MATTNFTHKQQSQLIDAYFTYIYIFKQNQIEILNG